MNRCRTVQSHWTRIYVPRSQKLTTQQGETDKDNAPSCAARWPAHWSCWSAPLRCVRRSPWIASHTRHCVHCVYSWWFSFVAQLHESVYFYVVGGATIMQTSSNINIVPMLYHNLISLECHPQTVLTKEGLAHRKIEAHAPRSIVDLWIYDYETENNRISHLTPQFMTGTPIETLQACNRWSQVLIVLSLSLFIVNVRFFLCS